MRNGIDKKAILAGINYMEFRYREADFGQFPKGLMYGLDIMGSWLYDDENAFSQVQLLSIYDRLKEAVNEGYFEKLIQKWLLDNTHGADPYTCAEARSCRSAREGTGGQAGGLQKQSFR